MSSGRLGTVPGPPLDRCAVVSPTYRASYGPSTAAVDPETRPNTPENRYGAVPFTMAMTMCAACDCHCAYAVGKAERCTAWAACHRLSDM